MRPIANDSRAGRRLEDPVTLRNILFSALVVVFAPGCSADEGDITTGTGSNPVCATAEAVCTGDAICGETGCEPAFDRPYQVRVASVRWPGKRDGECPDDRYCVFPGVTVYFTERDAAILDFPDGPGVAEIVVTAGSSLIVELRNTDCLIELTADRLRDGAVGCRSGSTSATLSLVAKPL
jgi:hypothetical protein